MTKKVRVQNKKITSGKNICKENVKLLCGMFPGVHILILNRIMIHFLTATLNYIPKILIITFITQYNRKILPITVSRKSTTKVSKYTCFLVLFTFFFITHTIIFITEAQQQIFPYYYSLYFPPLSLQNSSPP